MATRSRKVGMDTRSGKINSSISRWTRISVVVLIGVVAGVLHVYHVTEIHDRHLSFSLLSSLEREMTFFSELGFYYSFYKQIVQADSFTSAWNSLLSDTHTEHCPDATRTQQKQNETWLPCSPLNAFRRFNIYPELALAIAYRLLNSLNWLQAVCYEVDRSLDANEVTARVAPPYEVVRAMRTRKESNESLPPLLTTTPLKLTDSSVVSCVGIGEPVYFYLMSVFTLSGLILVGLTWSGWILASLGSSSSGGGLSSFWLPIWGALLPTVAFFCHHREATRVQWNPPLRESFAYPFFLLQHACLLYILASQYTGVLYFIFHCFLLLCFQLPWQFAQFALATQVAALFAAACLTVAVEFRQHGVTSVVSVELIARVRRVVLTHLLAHITTYFLQFGNQLLLLSPYLAGLIGVLFGFTVLSHRIAYRCSRMDRDSVQQPPGLFACLAQTLLLPSASAVSATVVLVTATSWALASGCLPSVTTAHDGGHIFDLLRHKFSLGGQFRTFHTMLYTCSPVFGFMQWQTILATVKTGLLPMVMFASIVFVILPIIGKLLNVRSSKLQTPSSSPPKTSSSGLNDEQYLLMSAVSMFVVIQLSFFTVMAALIMRLQVFWTPYLCLSTSLLAQPYRWRSVAGWRWLPSLQNQREKGVRPASPGSSTWPYWMAHGLLALLLAYMSVHGKKSLEAELAIANAFSDTDNEALTTWLRSLPANQRGSENIPWVITGSLSLMGQLRLLLSPPGAGKFAFTNHPHYEDAALRQRTILVDSIYSRKPVDEVWHIYRHILDADFVVVNEMDCLNDDHGCSRVALHDLVDPEAAKKSQIPLCRWLFTPSHSTRHVGATPPALLPFFHVVYVDKFRNLRVVLLVHR